MVLPALPCSLYALPAHCCLLQHGQEYGPRNRARRKSTSSHDCCCSLLDRHTVGKQLTAPLLHVRSQVIKNGQMLGVSERPSRHHVGPWFLCHVHFVSGIWLLFSHCSCTGSAPWLLCHTSFPSFFQSRVRAHSFEACQPAWECEAVTNRSGRNELMQGSKCYRASACSRC